MAVVDFSRAVRSDLPTGPIVLYDGDCGLCATSVKWILDHERHERHERGDELRFAPLQGATAALLRASHPRIPAAIDSVVYVAAGRAHLRSQAVLHLAQHLRAPWRWAHALRWLPGIVLDLPYRLVAALRFRIWGRADACQLATPAQRARFLP
jgi:predicted DCC family thiol-disulfide oxidoreductase YuxK